MLTKEQHVKYRMDTAEDDWKKNYFNQGDPFIEEIKKTGIKIM